MYSELIKQRLYQLPTCEKRFILNSLGIKERKMATGDNMIVDNPFRQSSAKSTGFQVCLRNEGFYYDSKEKQGGDLIDLVQRFNGWDFKETIKQFCNALRIPMIARSAELTESDKVKFIWNKSIKTNDHKYLKKHGITIGNARVNIFNNKKSICIPMTDYIPSESRPLEPMALMNINENGSMFKHNQYNNLFHVASDYKRPKEVIVMMDDFVSSRLLCDACENVTVIFPQSSAYKSYILNDLKLIYPQSQFIEAQLFSTALVVEIEHITIGDKSHV